jgi:hypothetical protein
MAEVTAASRADALRRLPSSLTVLVWGDPESGNYHGIVRELSLTAEDEGPELVVSVLNELVDTYIDDAIALDAVDHLIPRAVSPLDWWRLTLGLRLRNLAAIA